MSAIRNVILTSFASIMFSLSWMVSVGLAQPPTALQTFFVKSRQFEIPVSIDSRGTNRPGELQLYVSRDSGVSWEFYSRESPDVQRFSFSAPGDGEYWFAVRPFAGRSANRATGTRFTGIWFIGIWFTGIFGVAGQFEATAINCVAADCRRHNRADPGYRIVCRSDRHGGSETIDIRQFTKYRQHTALLSPRHARHRLGRHRSSSDFLEPRQSEPDYGPS